MHFLAHVLPFMLGGLGAIVLLALLFIPARAFLRKRLVPLPSPKVPPSGAAPWSRTQVSTPPASFNAVPTIANAAFKSRSNGASPGGPRTLATPPGMPVINSPVNQAQVTQPFPALPAPPGTGNAGMTWSQQPFPATPLLMPEVGPAKAFAEQISGERSADMMVVSDPSRRIMLQQHGQNGQAVKQASEQTS